MTREKLSQLYYLKKEIKQLELQIAELEAMADGHIINTTGLPSGKGVSDKVGNYAAQIVDLKALLDLNLKKCFHELNKLNRYIQSVDDPLVRQILVCRFEQNMTWQQIENAIGGGNSSEGLRKKMYRFLKNN